MPLPHPCCGALPLQQATKICGIAHAALNFVLLIALFVGLMTLMLATFLVAGFLGALADTVLIHLLIALLIITLMLVATGLQIAGGVLLYFAAEKKNMKRVKTWITAAVVLTIVVFALSIIYGINMLVMCSGNMDCFTGGATMAGSVFPWFTIYFLWVAYAFHEEQTKGNGAVASGVMQPAPVYGQSSKSQVPAKSSDRAPDYNP